MIESGEVSFAFGPRKFASGNINAHLLILSHVRLSLIRSAGPVGEDVAPKGLKVELSFPLGAEETFPVRFVHDDDSAATTAYELVAGDLVHLYGNRRCGNIFRRDVVGRDLCGEGVQNVLVKASWQVPGDILNIVGGGTRLVA